MFIYTNNPRDNHDQPERRHKPNSGNSQKHRLPHGPSVTVYFHWYGNTSYSLDLNYIPLPPTAVPTSWTLINYVYVGNWQPGVTYGIDMSWTSGANVPENVTIAMRVVRPGDDNLYDNIAG